MKKRTPFNVPRYVYHVTTKPNTFRAILSKGFNPQSVGASGIGEGDADKTYAYINGLDAVGYFDDLLGGTFEHGYDSWNAFDYPIALIRIDTQKAGVDWYHDVESEGFEGGHEWVFTDKFIDSDAIDIVPMNKIIQTLKTKWWPRLGWSKKVIDEIPMPNDEVFESKRLSVRDLRILITEAFKNFDINKLKTAKDPIRYIKSTCTQVGEGGGRVVYSTMTGLVVKVAKEQLGGIKSNKNETRKSRKAPQRVVNRVIDHAPGFEWVITRFATPIRDEETLDSWISVMTDGTVRTLNDLKRNLYSSISGGYVTLKNNEWFDDLSTLCKDVKISPAELHVDNWGLLDGNLVVIDVE